jgi:hypothetical protein
MEIRIILDDRIVNGAKRIFSRSGLAALTALTLLAGGAALVAQEASDASNIFSPGEVISSSAVNQNFQELHDLAQAQDEEVAAKVSGIETSEYKFVYTDSIQSTSKGGETMVVNHDFCAVSNFWFTGSGDLQGFGFTNAALQTAPGEWTLHLEIFQSGTGVPYAKANYTCFDFVN